MLKTVAFIFAVWIALCLLGMGAPAIGLTIDGQHVGEFAGGLLAAGAALAAAVLALAILFAVIMGLVVMAIGIPIVIVALIVCALFAPLLLPFVVLIALGMMFFCALGGLFA